MLCLHGFAQFDNALQVSYKNNKKESSLLHEQIFV